MLKISVLILSVLSFYLSSFSSDDFVKQNFKMDTVRAEILCPDFEVFYLGKPLTSDIIKDVNPIENQILLFQLSLTKPKGLNDSLKNMVCVIDESQIIFVINEFRPRKKTIYQGHTILLNVHWPQKFPLGRGSKILFKIKYSYKMEGRRIDSGELLKEIAF